MKARDLNEVPADEIGPMIADSVHAVIFWLKRNGISAGSTPTYNLYGAVQEAIRKEWETSRRPIDYD